MNRTIVEALPRIRCPHCNSSRRIARINLRTRGMFCPCGATMTAELIAVLNERVKNREVNT